MESNMLKKLFTGTWQHESDNNLAEFFDAIGTPDFQKRYMLTSTPRMEFVIRGERITLTISPHPVTIPQDAVELDITLNQELSFEAKRTMLKLQTEWTDNKLIQYINLENSEILPHRIEHYIDKEGKLIQEYKLLNKEGEITGTRTFIRQGNRGFTCCNIT